MPSLNPRRTHASKPIVSLAPFSRICPPLSTIAALRNISNPWSICISTPLTRPRSWGRLNNSMAKINESMALLSNSLDSLFIIHHPQVLFTLIGLGISNLTSDYSTIVPKINRLLWLFSRDFLLALYHRHVPPLNLPPKTLRQPRPIPHFHRNQDVRVAKGLTQFV